VVDCGTIDVLVLWNEQSEEELEEEAATGSVYIVADEEDNIELVTASLMTSTRKSNMGNVGVVSILKPSGRGYTVNT
tara:strand:+ start:71 stop:301 length:231 start_codon:yes stop_codon:yes gene_type:complete